ncbi:MAG TPA: glutamate mutase L [Anaerolineaceae bacterium]|nr:glutamate mutase L [Anaerolineaceae bacterium]
MSDTISTATILGIKIDTQTTKLFLFDVVDAKYTLLATSEAKTTHSAPYNDIREGLFKAIDHLQKVTGKFILDNEMNIIFPSQEDGNGVDLISISYGFLNFASIITAGLLENVSIESNNNLIQLTHLSHTDQISLNDSRTLEEVFNSIQNKRPDIILLSGGTENGATKSVIRLLEIILFCTKNLPGKEIPEFIYAGNSQLGEKFEEVFKNQQLKFHKTGNIRPSIHTESLLPALNTINEITKKFLPKIIPGLDFLFSFPNSNPIPYSQAYGTMVKFLSNINPEKNEKVLLVDFNKEIFCIAGAQNGKLVLFSQNNPLLNDSDNITMDLESTEIIEWLEDEINFKQVQNYLLNKSIHPHSIPENNEELSLEKAVNKYLLKKLFNSFQKQSGIEDNSFHQILINGDILTGYLSQQELILFLLDTIQPIGISNLFNDQYGIMPVLGSIAQNNSILPIHLMESNAISLLAKVFSIPCKGKDGTPVLNLKVEFKDGTYLEELIVKGTITKLPITSGQPVKIFIDVIGNIEMKSVLKQYETGILVQAGTVGIVFDTRNRPLSLPKIDQERHILLKKWREDLDS